MKNIFTFYRRSFKSTEKKELKILQHIRDESHRFGLEYNLNERKITVKEQIIN